MGHELLLSASILCQAAKLFGQEEASEDEDQDSRSGQVQEMQKETGPWNMTSAYIGVSTPNTQLCSFAGTFPFFFCDEMGQFGYNTRVVSCRTRTKGRGLTS